MKMGLDPKNSVMMRLRCIMHEKPSIFKASIQESNLIINCFGSQM